MLYSLRNIEYRYDKYFCMNIRELHIPKGKIVGLLGPNGSGKTTLLKILAFLYEKNMGELIFDGELIDNENLNKKRRCVTMLLEEPYLLRRKVRDNIKYAVKLSGNSESNIDYAYYLSILGLSVEQHLLKSYNQLSFGESKRVAMLMHLLLNREVLLLDEPTNNIDGRSKKYLEEALVHLKNSGKTIIFSSHDINFTMKHADIIHSLYEGNLYNDMLINIIDNDVNDSLKQVIFNAVDVKYYSNECSKELIKARIVGINFYNNRYLITIEIDNNICYLCYNNVLFNKDVLFPGNDIYLCVKDNILYI